MGHDIDGIHHVGHVVRDFAQAAGLYDQLGFALPPANYRSIPVGEGAQETLVGLGNSHATFADSFVEVVTNLGPGSPNVAPESGAGRVWAEPEMMPRLLAEMQAAAGMITARLDRFEGLHILALRSAGAEQTAERLTAGGIVNSGARTLFNEVDTPEGKKAVPITFIEVGTEEGMQVPEGRIAVAEKPDAEVTHGRDHLVHPNGAVGLVESVLCVDDADLALTEQRYEKYFGRSASGVPGKRTFDLGASRVVLVNPETLKSLLPGEVPPAVPGFVAYGVAVQDVPAARALVAKNGLPTTELPEGAFFVPAAAALGAAVIFRPAV